MPGQTIDQLTETFRQLGAPEPETWASSQVNEGIPQLHAYVFLKEAFAKLVSSGNDTWIDNMIRSKGPQSEAMQRLVAQGVDRADLTAVVRDMQIDALFSFCFLADCPDRIVVDGEEIAWGLFVTDADNKPIEPLSGLHESVITTDPECQA